MASSVFLIKKRLQTKEPSKKKSRIHLVPDIPPSRYMIPSRWSPDSVRLTNRGPNSPLPPSYAHIPRLNAVGLPTSVPRKVCCLGHWSRSYQQMRFSYFGHINHQNLHQMGLDYHAGPLVESLRWENSTLSGRIYEIWQEGAQDTGQGQFRAVFSILYRRPCNRNFQILGTGRNI